MNFTLFTDASYDHDMKIGTWAAWVKCDAGVATEQGIFKGQLTSSNAAELGAVANGIAVIIKRFKPEPGSTILIESDSQHALSVVRGPTPTLKADGAKMNRWLRGMERQYGLVLRVRHVQGHSKALDKRTSVNVWCDRACHAELQRARLLVEVA